MWASSDGTEVKKILKRIDKIKLSDFSEDLLFEVLFTNSYPPKSNLNSEEFLKIKIEWLIKNKRYKDLETLLKINPKIKLEIDGGVNNLNSKSLNKLGADILVSGSYLINHKNIKKASVSLLKV